MIPGRIEKQACLEESIPHKINDTCLRLTYPTLIKSLPINDHGCRQWSFFCHLQNCIFVPVAMNWIVNLDEMKFGAQLPELWWHYTISWQYPGECVSVVNISNITQPCCYCLWQTCIELLPLGAMYAPRICSATSKFSIYLQYMYLVGLVPILTWNPTPIV